MRTTGTWNVKTFSHLWQYLAEFLLEWGMFQFKSCSEKQNRFYVQLVFFFENLAFYEIMSKNVVEPERTQMTKWRRSISKATRVQARAYDRAPTHTGKHTRTYVLLVALPRQQRTIMLRLYIDCFGCWTYSQTFRVFGSWHETRWMKRRWNMGMIKTDDSRSAQIPFIYSEVLWSHFFFTFELRSPAFCTHSLCSVRLVQ